MSEQVLVDHKTTWEQKTILRQIYHDWYLMIEQDLSHSEKPVLEIGAGTGNFKAFHSDVIASDIVPCPWLDVCLDAHIIPFAESSFGNLILIDVLHHLADPIRFLSEAYRVLEPGGKLFLLEPYPSPFSSIVYKLFHPEPFDFQVDFFTEGKHLVPKDPWAANQAAANLLFFKNLRQFVDRFAGHLQLEKRERISFLLYPLSGGFTRPQLVPDAAIPALNFIEKCLKPFSLLFAFRCYIVLIRV